MPYTFAHIGYVLPIKKEWKQYFSITGLVFGSLAPDCDILFRLTKIRFHIFQYDIKTIFLILFPIALISAFCFHVFCRNVIIENLPRKFELKYQKYNTFNFLQHFKQHYFIVSASILFAILFHLFLDFLCHCLNAYSVKMILLELTNNNIIANLSYIFSIYGLPIIFSLVGFYMIFVYEYHKNISIKDFAITTQKFTFWISMFLITILFSVLKFYITEIDNEFFIDSIIISLTSSFLVAIYATCMLYYFIQKFKTI